MKPLTSFMVLAVVIVTLAACGDNKLNPDASVHHDSGNPDAPSFPAPPTLGAQIDRMGRPAITTALIAVLASGPARNAEKDAYNHAPDAAAWRTTMLQNNVTIERELANNLAVFDALDKGLSTPMAGCQSALKYTGPPGPMSYVAEADLFADDQLYVDTSKGSCTSYLALELEQASGGSISHTTCGGRTLRHDVIDLTYSLLFSGVFGLDPRDLTPLFHDGVAAHTNVDDQFPFVGVPN